MANPDSETLQRIQRLAEERTRLSREYKDAKSERLSSCKEALHDLEELIQESKGAKNGESPKHLKAIQKAHETRARVIEETSEKVREAKKAYKAIVEEFEQAIIDSRQGSLFTEGEAQP